MNKLTFLLIVLLFTGTKLKAQNDTLTKVKSQHAFEKTVEKLQTILSEKGLKIFATIDHAKGAESVSMELRPTTLILFGNPAIGTKLMQCDQRSGIELPMKYLVWEDEDGNVWIGYSEPTLLQTKYILEGCDATIAKMSGALSKFAGMAAQ